MTTPCWAAIVPAAGASRRMGRDKILAPEGGLPVLARTLQVLRAAGLGQIVVGIPRGAAARLRAEALVPHGLDDIELVEGGATRQETVARALAALPPAVDHVLIHDAARPRCSTGLVRAVMAAALARGAATAALPVTDTVHRAAGDAIAQTLDRAGLWLAQTPQAFARPLLARAHAAGIPGTDDAGMVASLGEAVALVRGEAANIKLTTAADLAPSGPPWAVGSGYDVHRLVPDRPLRLGGVTVPFTHGLLGHSDADVLAHAVCDAVLGGAALGDIGRHFPPGDPRFAGADSLGLLRRCAALTREAGWEPAQADALIIAERPALAPFLPEMARCLAAALGCDPGRVNVKAGTNEGLGALGRQEGIAASAVVLLVRRPPAAV